MGVLSRFDNLRAAVFQEVGNSRLPVLRNRATLPYAVFWGKAGTRDQGNSVGNPDGCKLVVVMSGFSSLLDTRVT